MDRTVKASQTIDRFFRIILLWAFSYSSDSVLMLFDVMTIFSIRCFRTHKMWYFEKSMREHAGDTHTAVPVSYLVGSYLRALARKAGTADHMRSAGDGGL